MLRTRRHAVNIQTQYNISVGFAQQLSRSLGQEHTSPFKKYNNYSCINMTHHEQKIFTSYIARHGHVCMRVSVSRPGRDSSAGCLSNLALRNSHSVGSDLEARSYRHRKTESIHDLAPDASSYRVRLHRLLGGNLCFYLYTCTREDNSCVQQHSKSARIARAGAGT